MLFLFVFGSLFASADAVFAQFLKDVTSALDPDDLAQWVFGFVLVATATLAACYLRVASPQLDRAEYPHRRLATIE